jgi:hypothetical protein
MTTNINIKPIFDIPVWRPEGPPLAAIGAGMSVAWDHRNADNSHTGIFLLRTTTALDMYDPINGDWTLLPSPALGGSIAAGSTAVFHSGQGPTGTIAAGATTSSITLTTALPAAVGANQLANRGDGAGFRIRIIGNTAGGSGLIEERVIVANSGGTTPTIWLDTPLSFTPASGAGYEIRSGRVYMLGAGATAAGFWKFYDVATNSISANLTVTNLPATIGTDSNAVALSESYVPWNRVSGEGFVEGGATYDGGKNCILATATAAGTITGSGMPADLQTNEYRNFQVRIVEDTLNPTAVNQRRRIASHTSGSTGVFTLSSNWTVTPSSSAKFVIENDNDKILLRSSAATSVYNYNITANTWDTTTWAAGVAHGAGVFWEQGFGYARDPGSQARHSQIFCIRGGGSAAIDVLDIAGGANGAWTNDIVYGRRTQTFTTGTSACYDPATKGGQYLHININGTQRFAMFDMKNRVLTPGVFLRFPQSTAVVGQKMAVATFVDGTAKASFVYALNNSQAFMHSYLAQ